MQKYLLDLGIGRRVIHVVLVVLMIAGVRACGGATQAEDRLGVASRWMAQKTGLEGAKDAWDTTVRPPIAAVTTKLSTAIYGAVVTFMDAAEAVVDGTTNWVADSTSRLMAAVEGSIRSTLTPNRKDQDPNKPNGRDPVNDQRSGAR